MLLPDFESRLASFAEVILRVGVNLQKGQRLLIAEPYELQGVARSAEVIVNAISKIIGRPAEVIWGDGAKLREFAKRNDWHGFAALTAANARKMESYVRNGDALLFLIGSQPNLMHGIPGEDAAELRRISAENFGEVSHQLMRGLTNWTAAPAPNPVWAQTAYADAPSDERLARLWSDVFSALRVTSPDPLAAWQSHLAALAQKQAELNTARYTHARYEGEGTSLTVALPAEHQWCTAQLKTRFGIPFLANLPTEEVFTVPHKDSTTGRLQVARPVHHAGSVIEGLELTFDQGRIVDASATQGAELLETLLSTDDGAGRLGEIAIVPQPTPLADVRRSFYHTLLDENSCSHVALGEAYPFCLREPDDEALNRSIVHVDLPLDARVTLERR